MKRNLYKLIATFALVFAFAVSQAQITVTYQVDITNYLASGATLNANGIRIGGDFAALGATTTGGTAVPDWTPSDATCAMTDLGNNIWSIDIVYADSAVGNTQLFKFVNGDWGTNEGTDASNTIGADSCGMDDGAGNVNRTLNIPEINVGYQWCWDHCFKCDGSSPLLSGINEINTNITSLEVTPNLASVSTQINYQLVKAGSVNMTVRSFAGNVVATLVNKVQSPGSYQLDYATANLANGIYLVQINSNGGSITQRFVVNH